MKASSSIFERRIEILFMVIKYRKITVPEKCCSFKVSKNTVYNDISFLSRYAPIYTKQGKNGGIYLLDGYSNDLFVYLSKNEEKLLSELMGNVEQSKKIVLQGIINRYSMPREKI
ncbi:MAG: HTH domain-containing protein [Oscillospiraceae bacterium]|nr:HTH domain-containing protein [Oscillospiraceae bacterium]